MLKIGHKEVGKTLSSNKESRIQATNRPRDKVSPSKQTNSLGTNAALLGPPDDNTLRPICQRDIVAFTRRAKLLTSAPAARFCPPNWPVQRPDCWPMAELLLLLWQDDELVVLAGDNLAVAELWQLTSGARPSLSLSLAQI